MKSNEKIKMNIFGKERDLVIDLVGDNSPDLTDDDEFEVVTLVPKEKELVNWLQKVDFSKYKDKILQYINYIKDIIDEPAITESELENEDIFCPTEILVNVSEDMDEDTADVALFAESEDIEDGIMVAFKDGKYFGISGFDDCMNCFEEFDN